MEMSNMKGRPSYEVADEQSEEDARASSQLLRHSQHKLADKPALHDTFPWLQRKVPSSWISESRLAWALIGILLVVLLLREVQRQRVDYTDITKWNHITDVPSAADRLNDKPNTERLAYITLFTETMKAGVDGYTYEDDTWFIAARILTYQLVHAPATRSRKSIPFIIMVTQDVSQEKQDRLARDGATVVPVELVQDGQDWLTPGQERWRWMLTKFRAWEMTEYNRMAFIDSDFILQHPLDGVFDAVNASIVPTLNNDTQIKEDEYPLPTEYLLASMPELWPNHTYPPTHEDFMRGDMINGGFLVFAPSQVMFDYYTSVARLPWRFWPSFMEQSLLNYAHRLEGNMPFKEIPVTFNSWNPTDRDIAGGVASVHYKWWLTPDGYPELTKYFMAMRWTMEAFYEMQDNLDRHNKSSAVTKVVPPPTENPP